MTKINSTEIRLGTVFSENVFFYDGECMFLGKNKPAKAFHLFAIKRWNIPYLLTNGKKLTEEQIEKLKQESISSKDDIQELEELEEL